MEFSNLLSFLIEIQLGKHTRHTHSKNRNVDVTKIMLFMNVAHIDATVS